MAKPEPRVRAVRRARRRVHGFAIYVGGAALLMAGGAAVAGPKSAPQTMPVDQIKRGMKGYAVTVFHGTQTDRFEIEVIDVVKDYQPGQDAVLFDSPDPRLQHTGIVGGMSGSPIYIEGKLVGALAYGYHFSKDPLGGITPIANMLEVSELPYRPELHPQPSPRGRDGSAAWADTMLGLDVEPLPPRRRPHQVGRAGQIAGLAPLGVPLSVSGFSPSASRMLGADLGMMPVAGGSGAGSATGTGTDSAPGAVAPKKRWTPGDSVSVLLIAGDNSVAPNGTVTWVGGKNGERLMAFGHNMFGDGPTKLPIADAHVHTIIPSVDRSVKLSSPISKQGTMIQDRQPGISLRGDIDVEMIPVTTTVRPAGALTARTYHSAVANDATLTTNLVTALLLDAVDEGGNDAVELVLRTHHKLIVRTSKGRRTIEVDEETFYPRGVSRGVLARSLALLLVDVAMDNEFEVGEIESVEQSAELVYGAPVETIESIRVITDEVRAGEIVELELTMKAPRHRPTTRTVALRVPEDAGDEKIVVELAGGDYVRPYSDIPTDLDELLDNATLRYPSRAIVASIYREAEGLSTRHGLLTDLPDSVLESLGSHGGSTKPVRFKRAARRVLNSKTLIEGEHRLEIEVLPRLAP
jgi:hypothetical protein